MKDRVVPKKNYIKLLFLIIIVVGLTFMIFDYYNKYKNRRLESSYFDGKINEVNLNDLNDVLREASTDMFVIVTEINNEVNYKMETDLYKLIKNYDLIDNCVYLDVTNEEIDTVNGLLGSNIKKAPAVIYYKNGNYISMIDSENNVLNNSNFQQLLDEYELAS